jgi:hypothetical protein
LEGDERREEADDEDGDGCALVIFRPAAAWRMRLIRVEESEVDGVGEEVGRSPSSDSSTASFVSSTAREGCGETASPPSSWSPLRVTWSAVANTPWF